MRNFSMRGYSNIARSKSVKTLFFLQRKTLTSRTKAPKLVNISTITPYQGKKYPSETNWWHELSLQNEGSAKEVISWLVTSSCVASDRTILVKRIQEYMGIHSLFTRGEKLKISESKEGVQPKKKLPILSKFSHDISQNFHSTRQ